MNKLICQKVISKQFKIFGIINKQYFSNQTKKLDINDMISRGNINDLYYRLTKWNQRPDSSKLHLNEASISYIIDDIQNIQLMDRQSKSDHIAFYLKLIILWKSVVSNLNKIQQKEIRALYEPILFKIKNVIMNDNMMNTQQMMALFNIVICLNDNELINIMNNKLGINIDIKGNLLKKRLETEIQTYKKSTQRIKLYFKLYIYFLLISGIIGNIFRLYYYLEYDVDILEPRVSDYHIYRFR